MRARSFIAAVRSGAGHRALISDRPLISIILPTRDRAALLPTAIASIQAQTYDHWELLIVDDGSRDATPSVVAGFLKDPRIRLLQTGGKGVAAARNAAMAQAKGELFAYLDSDNSWQSEFLEIAASHLLERNLDLVYSALVSNDGWRIRYVGADFDYADLSHRNFIDINVMVHRRALYDRRGGCDETLKRMSDWDLVLRYAKDSSVAYAPFIGCAYDGRLTRADRITVSEPVGWTYVVLGKHHLNWSALQSDASARDRDLVSIVIPVHGQPELTAACLASLYEIEAGCLFELVLVDNGSDPTTSALLDRCVSTHPNARLVRNWENLNFALGCNLGFAATRGSIVVFLNNDTRVQPGWLRALAAPFNDTDCRRGAAQAALPGRHHSDLRHRRRRAELPALRTLSRPSRRCTSPRQAAHALDDQRRMPGNACRGLRGPAWLRSDLRQRPGGQRPVSSAESAPRQDLPRRAGLRGHPPRRRHAGPRPLHLQQSPDLRRTLEETHLVADDMAHYRRDGYAAHYDAPDVPEWEPAGLAVFRPVLEPAPNVAMSPAPAPASSVRLLSFAIKIACPSEAVRDEWGDYHFARSLSQALQRLGCRSRIDYCALVE